MQEMQVDLQAATTERCQQWALSLSETLQQAVKVTQSLGKSLMGGEVDKTLANASCYLHLFGHIIVAWMWLRQANAAAHALGSANSDSERNFYQGKLQASPSTSSTGNYPPWLRIWCCCGIRMIRV